MKIFISWSGDKSREYAAALREWLPLVIQSIDPFFTPGDIEKGRRWGNEIAQELEKSEVGILCMTPDNLTKPWIMFEAGSLAKGATMSRVCPILFGVEKSQVQGPLAQFQSTLFNEDEVKKLLETLNEKSINKLASGNLDKIFKKFWPEIQAKIEEIDASFVGVKLEEAPPRPPGEILEEILTLTRSNSNSNNTSAEQLHFLNANLTHVRGELFSATHEVDDLKSLVLQMDTAIENYFFKNIRDATTEEFIAWREGALENYSEEQLRALSLDYDKKFGAKGFKYADHDIILPRLSATKRVTLIVKKGVSVDRAVRNGFSRILFMDGFLLEHHA